MTIQILVPLHTYPDGNSPNIAGHARAVARHLGGAVHALQLNANFPPITSPLANLLLDTTTLVAGAKDRCRDNGKALMEAMRTEMDRHDVPLRSTEIEYYPTELTDAVSDIARYHDLTILGVGNHDAALRGTAEDVIFATGRPVLLVPEDLEVGAFDRVAIAWDGSRVAARAVADAWPFLQRAANVSILTVTGEKTVSQRVGERLVDYLGRRGTAATAVSLAAENQPIAEVLQKGASALGAGILVMGGFGHSRMRDFVLGSATSGILRSLEMPVLISH